MTIFSSYYTTECAKTWQIRTSNWKEQPRSPEFHRCHWWSCITQSSIAVLGLGCSSGGSSVYIATSNARRLMTLFCNKICKLQWDLRWEMFLRNLSQPEMKTIRWGRILPWSLEVASQAKLIRFLRCSGLTSWSTSQTSCASLWPATSATSRRITPTISCNTRKFTGYGSYFIFLLTHSCKLTLLWQR